MTALIMTAQILLGLSILVILHEWGHYIAARAFGIKVEKFYLFFDAWGYKLFSFRKGDTEYGVGWLPLGGYVKIAGMIDESMDKSFVQQEPKPWEFRSKPAWQRLIVMLGGVTVNAILGVLIFSGMTYFYGERYLPMEEVKYGIVPGEVGKKVGLEEGDQILAVNGQEIDRFEELLSPSIAYEEGTTLTIKRDGRRKEITLPDNFLGLVSDAGFGAFVQPRRPFSVERVQEGAPADRIGLQAGDRITAINGEPIRFFHEVRSALQANAGEEVSLEITRDSETLQKTATVQESGTLGFYPKFALEYERQTYGLGPSLAKGSAKAWDALYSNVVGLGKIFTGDVDPSKSVSGPIGIATIYGGTFNWARFWGITALLSMVLAFMNLLPIPALDGGHVFFLLIEMVRGKPLDEKVMGIAQTIGIIILISLMVFAFSNDIYNVFLN
jgi:regulator of sigma E protease